MQNKPAEKKSTPDGVNSTKTMTSSKYDKDIQKDKTSTFVKR